MLALGGVLSARLVFRLSGEGSLAG